MLTPYALTKLHFGAPQTTVLIVFCVLVVGFLVVFLAIGLNANKSIPFERVRDTGYALRRYWLGFLLLSLVVVVGGGFLMLPYGIKAKPVAEAKVVSGQFYWTIQPHTFSQGHVLFDVTSNDVNHGMGVYDPDGQLIGSVQAMPTYHNRLEMDLNKPGEYLVSCLEYCGLGHHKMMATFTVHGGSSNGHR